MSSTESCRELLIAFIDFLALHTLAPVSSQFQWLHLHSEHFSPMGVGYVRQLLTQDVNHSLSNCHGN